MGVFNGVVATRLETVTDAEAVLDGCHFQRTVAMMWKGMVVGRWFEMNCEVQIQFNGALYLVRHVSISDQAIGSGKTMDEALADAEKTRAEIILKRRQRETAVS